MVLSNNPFDQGEPRPSPVQSFLNPPPHVNNRRGGQCDSSSMSTHVTSVCHQPSETLETPTISLATLAEQVQQISAFLSRHPEEIRTPRRDNMTQNLSFGTQISRHELPH